jgi:glycosyltransferase involved in cell wall biosynthesis
VLIKPIVQFDRREGRYLAQRASLYARRNDASELAAKIVELLDDPARRKGMGEYGRRRVERELASHHEAPKLLAAYEALWSGAADSRAARSGAT